MAQHPASLPQTKDEINAMNIKDRIIVALDVDSLDEATPLVEILTPHVGCFKIGLELMTSAGTPQAIEKIHALGGSVFLDGKFDDIPNTVARASKAVSSLGIKMFDVHASAGIEALEAAAANKGTSTLLAVTVLTAIDDRQAELIYGAPSKTKVLQFAQDAKQAGCDGIVCSPQELEFLRARPDLAELIRITPGIRPIWAETGDQKRIMTPGEAIRAGATALVIGRPITNPPAGIGSPVDAVRRIAEEIATAL